MALFTLPAELIEAIVSSLLQSDILGMGQTCSSLHPFAIAKLNKPARVQGHTSGYELTAKLEEVSSWFNRKSSGSILEWSVVHGQFRTFLQLLAVPGMDFIRADEYGVTMLHKLSMRFWRDRKCQVTVSRP